METKHSHVTGNRFAIVSGIVMASFVLWFFRMDEVSMPEAGPLSHGVSTSGTGETSDRSLTPDAVESIQRLISEKHAYDATHPPRVPRAWEINPFPRASKNATLLRYPPGIDISIYWGDGRFAIWLNNLVENSSSQTERLISDVSHFRQSREHLFVRTRDITAMLNLQSGEFSTFSDTNDFPESHILELQLLGSATNVGNYVIDQSTFDVFQVVK